jgi:hypothetical protein
MASSVILRNVKGATKQEREEKCGGETYLQSRCIRVLWSLAVVEFGFFGFHLADVFAGDVEC